MGILDGGIQAVFGAAFGGLYHDATLLGGDGPIYDDGGNITGYGRQTWPCKAQVDAVDWSMRDGYIDGDVRILILSAGLEVAVTADHEIEVQAERFRVDGGYQRWSISAPSMDAAGSHWVVRGRRAG